jgi:uncharacterized protein YdaU (DUF1376 family)
VNFYKHHLGDYAAATTHLSWDEDCAYRRLMDQYYKREVPIPSDIKDACRLARATTPSQRKAVESVLKEFFTHDADGWHQKRCDEEITNASQQAATNRRIAEEREARKRPRIVHEPLDASLNESCTNRSPATSGEREPIQTPDSRLHKPDSSKKQEEEARASRLPTDWGLTDARKAVAESERLDPVRTHQKFTDHWRSASGANARKRDWDAAWRNWCRNEADRKTAPKVNGSNAHREELGKFDRIMARSHAQQTFNADGKPVDENGNVIPF